MMRRGQFLELSIPTGDIAESLEFYRRIGFTEVPVNDIRQHYYAVITDGRIAIGLHGAGFEEPTLAFVWPELAHHVRTLEDAGHEFEFVELGEDTFNEAGLLSPDGHPLRFIEARTFSRGDLGDVDPPVVGRSTEISLRCDEYAPTIAFWEHADFITDEGPDTDLELTDVITDAERDSDLEQADAMMLRARGVVLGLRTGLPWRVPALRFAPDDVATTLAELERRDLQPRRKAGGRVLTAPEGTPLLIVDE
ncbi:MAG: VOC family protein [Gammaproteobacteria bacterium]